MAFEHLKYYELLEDFLNEYKLEFGRRKLEKIHRKIQTSKKISTLIYLSKQKGLIPNKNDFLYSLYEVPYFMISKADTLAVAALLSLERWNQECNKQLGIASEGVLRDIAGRILEDCVKININI